MKEQKTLKVMDVWDRGIHITCTKVLADQETPYHVYLNWYDCGYHKKRMGKARNMVDVLGFTQVVFTKALECIEGKA